MEVGSASDAYAGADFDRLAEIYAEDAPWLNADPEGPHCHSRDDLFTMFRHRMHARIRIRSDELRAEVPCSTGQGRASPRSWPARGP